MKLQIIIKNILCIGMIAILIYLLLVTGVSKFIGFLIMFYVIRFLIRMFLMAIYTVAVFFLIILIIMAVFI